MAYDTSTATLDEVEKGEELSPAQRERRSERERLRQAIREVMGSGFDIDSLPPGQLAELSAKMAYDPLPFDDDDPENAFDLEDRLTLTQDEKSKKKLGAAPSDDDGVDDDDDDDVPQTGRKKRLPARIRKILDNGPRGSEANYTAAVKERRESSHGEESEIVPSTSA